MVLRARFSKQDERARDLSETRANSDGVDTVIDSLRSDIWCSFFCFFSVFRLYFFSFSGNFCLRARFFFNSGGLKFFLILPEKAQCVLARAFFFAAEDYVMSDDFLFRFENAHIVRHFCSMGEAIFFLQ